MSQFEETRAEHAETAEKTLTLIPLRTPRTLREPKLRHYQKKNFFMQTQSSTSKIAQSASAIGAAILGFGAGIEFGTKLIGYGIWIIVIGALIHVYGMYLIQMKNANKNTGIAKLLLVTAWICLIALVATIIYLSIRS